MSSALQLEACRPFVKHASRPPSLAAIPYHVAQAVRQATYGRPGAAYIDLPGNLLNAKTCEEMDYFEW